MDGFWAEIESEIAGWLERRGEMSVAELASHLALSEEAVASLLAVLTVGSPVRICRVALAGGASPNAHPGVMLP